VRAFSADNVTVGGRVGVLALPFPPPDADRRGDSAMVRLSCGAGIGAGEAAGGGAVGGAGATGNAGRQGLVVAPAVAVAAGGLRYNRYIRDMAGQPGSGAVKAVRYIRYRTRGCSGRSGEGTLVRYMALIGLACGIVTVWRM
jgi:hypothetical protein